MRIVYCQPNRGYLVFESVEPPDKEITYGMLRLQSDGEWVIDEDSWRQTHEQLRKRINEAPSVLSNTTVASATSSTRSASHHGRWENHT